MPKLTPKHTAALARRTGLDFRAVRRSRRVDQLVQLEAELRAVATRISVLIARARAYKLAARLTPSPAERIDLRVREETTRHKLDHARLVRDTIKRELVMVKSAIHEQAQVGERIAPVKPDPEHDLNTSLRRLFNV